MHASFKSFMSLGPTCASFSHYFSYHHIIAFYHISLVVFFIFFSFFFFYLICYLFCFIFSPPWVVILLKSIVTSFPLSIPHALIQRSLVREGHLVKKSLCYFSTWECIYPLLMSSLGLILSMFRVCAFLYMQKKKKKGKKKEKKEKRKRKISTCVCA